MTNGGERKKIRMMKNLQAQWRRREDQDEEHNPKRRILKQCTSYKSTQRKLLLVILHVCTQSTAALCGAYAFGHV